MSLDHLRILVCDDEPAVQRATARTLRALGHDVTSTADAGWVLERAREGELDIDVLVVDVTMDGIDGPTLAREIGRHAAMAVLFISGHDPEALRARGFEVDRQHVLQKPFGREELKEALRTLLAGRAEDASPNATSSG